MRHAVIGIGSNSTRLLIGDVEAGKLNTIRRMREGTRLFAGLEDGMLSTQSLLTTVDAVARLTQTARADGAETLHVIATSAARDARNGAELQELVEAAAGVPLTIISGEEEARLSFLGASDGARSGMVDIGGGSTEIAVGGGNLPFQAGSAQLGAVRLLGEVPLLEGEGFARARAIARERAETVWRELSPPMMPDVWYGVGGTLTCLASIDMGLVAYDREAVHGHGLKRGAVENWARRLAKMPARARAEIPGMLPQRADIIAHGAIVLLGVMEALDIPRVTVSNRTNLDGYLLDIAGDREEGDTVDTVRKFYDASVEVEWARLDQHPFEFAINKKYIDRYVAPGDRVLDVGGGPGRYSLHLAGRGAEVTLLDLSQANVALAKEKADGAGLPLKAVRADVRRLEKAVDGPFDTILLMGPLYHLLEEADRVAAVEACLRKLKPGGVLIAAFISLLGGMIFAARETPESILWEGERAFYEKIIQREDFAGQGFTHAFMIEPRHVRPFMERFPLETLHLVGSEGITAPFLGQITAQSPEVVAAWLELSEALCEREDLLSYSDHLLYVGRKKEETP